MAERVFCMEWDEGNGFSKDNAQTFRFEELNEAEITVSPKTQNVRFLVSEGNCILNVQSASGYSDFWYDLSFRTDGIRLGHHLFLLPAGEHEIKCLDFRFSTKKIKFKFEILSLSEEMTEKMAHSANRLIKDHDTIEEKWKYQIQVYDEKVAEVVSLEEDKVVLNKAIEELKGEANFWKDHYTQMENSASWKLTAPIRSLNETRQQWKKRAPLKQKQKAFRQRVKEVGIEQAKCELYREYVGSYVDYFSALDVAKHVRENPDSLANVLQFAYECKESDAIREDACLWFGMAKTNSEKSQGQKNPEMGNETLDCGGFSLLVEVENPEPDALFAFLNFWLNQTYGNFELCILDRSDKTHRVASKILDWYAKVDGRILVRHVPRNKNAETSKNNESPNCAEKSLQVELRENSEAGKNGALHKNVRQENALLREMLPLATKEYVSVVHMEDVADVRLLGACAKALSEKRASFLYTDSDWYTQNPTDSDNPWFKPDFSPDYLRSMNYIRGFWCAKRELFGQLDLEQEELLEAGSYGCILHLTEAAANMNSDKLKSKSDEIESEKEQLDKKQPYETHLEEGCPDGKQPYETRQEILHLPLKLYYEKKQSLSGAEQTLVCEHAKRAIEQHLSRVGLQAEVELTNREASLFHIRYKLQKNQQENPQITILIPNKDHVSDLKRCIDSVIRKSTYPNYEIVIVENNSTKKETFDFYKQLEAGYTPEVHHNVPMSVGQNEEDSLTMPMSMRRDTEDSPAGAKPAECVKIRILQWKDAFNYSAINNFGMTAVHTEYVLLLNNDVEIITPNWIEEMLGFAEREDVGAVGAKLYYMDDTVQHAGVIIGLGGVAAHSHKDYPRKSSGYMYRLQTAQNLSAVTAACLLMRKSVYEEIGGMDEGYQVAFNDADFCMRIRKAGYLIVFTPFAELYHDESKSRGVEDTEEKAERFESEVVRFQKEWPQILKTGDPYYNVNLTSAKEDFSLKE